MVGLFDGVSSDVEDSESRDLEDFCFTIDFFAKAKQKDQVVPVLSANWSEEECLFAWRDRFVFDQTSVGNWIPPVFWE